MKHPVLQTLSDTELVQKTVACRAGDGDAGSPFAPLSVASGGPNPGPARQIHSNSFNF